MDVPHFSWGPQCPLSLLVAALALTAVTPALAAAEQRVSETAACGWPAGWSAGAVGFGAGYKSSTGSRRVREVQRRLKRAGARPGPVDGLFGPLTRAAVKRFQRRHGFGRTGVVGRRTLALLRSRTGSGGERARDADPRIDPSDAIRQSAPVPVAPAPAASSSPGTATVMALVLGLLLLAAAVIRELRAARRGRDRPTEAPAQPGGADPPPVLGYVTVSRDEARSGAPQAASAEIGTLCERRGWPLVKVVHDVDPASDRINDHPGLFHVLERIAGGEAHGIVVPRLRDLTGAVSDLGGLLNWLDESDAFLVALDLDLDTRKPEGRLAARAITEVSDWERRRIADRTRSGLAAARSRSAGGSRPSVRDDPELSNRIGAMRADGMSLQAIADTLNEEGVPTLRGGRQWRPSSVQAAAGYKRPAHRANGGGLPPARRRNGSRDGRG
jgi:DNA invertase Pin-like site-specific DNA recombinase